MMLHSWTRHELTNQSDQITEVWSDDGQIDKASDDLSEPFRVACCSGVKAKLHIPVQRSPDRFSFRNTKFEEYTQHIMRLIDQYAFRVADLFDPEEVMKVTEILHF